MRHGRWLRRLGRWALAALAGQVGGCLCQVSGITAALLRLARWALAVVGLGG